MTKLPPLHIALANSRQEPLHVMANYDATTTGPGVSVYSPDSENNSPVSPVFSSRSHLRHASSSSSLASTPSPFDSSEAPSSAKKEGLPLLVEEPHEREDEFPPYEDYVDISPCLCKSFRDRLFTFLATNLVRRLNLVYSPVWLFKAIGVPSL